MKLSLVRANTWWIGCILLLCGGLLLKISLDMDSSRQRGGLTEATQPDFFMQQATTRVYDEKGEVAYLLSAERWSHVRSETGVLLERPRLTAYRTESTQRWEAQAQRGYWISASGQLTLDQDVSFELWQAQQRQQQLLSSHIEIDYQQRTAYTDSPVRLITEQGELSGRGIRIDLAKGTAVLPNQVKGRYFPSQPGISQ